MEEGTKGSARGEDDQPGEAGKEGAAKAGAQLRETLQEYLADESAKYELRRPLPTSGETTGAQAIMQMLLCEGVNTVFGYPGGAIMPAYDALFDVRDDIRHVLVRHEQGAAHAAEGYAYATGDVGVCFATSGPGATNLVTGIADAMLDSVPLVCITGQVVGSLIGSDAFQETDIIGITIPITKWNYQIRRAEEIPEIIAKAFHIARSGRPGPVLLDITKDAQFGRFRWEDIKFVGPRNRYAKSKLCPEDVKKAAEIINMAKMPYMLIGHGVLIANAEREVMDLAEKAGIPVARTLLGLSAFPTSHPLCVGMLGMHGHYAPNMLSNKADVIIAVGMRFDDRVTGDLSRYANQAKVIHIEVDPAEVGKIIQPEVALIGDAKEALQALLPWVRCLKRDEWLEEFRGLERKERDEVIEAAIHPSQGKLLMSEVINRLSELTDGEAVVVADVGQHQMMAARYYRSKHPHSFITSGGLGTMGFALPAAMGAKIARPYSQIIAIIGDGSFQMNIQELGTIMQEGLSVKIIVMRNNFLGMVRQWQELFFDSRYSFTRLVNPDFVKVCQGYGIEAARVEQRELLDESLQKLLAAEGSYFLEAVVEKEENVFPMVPAGAAVHEIRLR